MSFWEHVDALRGVLVKAVAVVVVLTLALFAVMPWLFDHVILAPCRGDFILYRVFARLTAWLPGVATFSTSDFNVQLINIQLASQFFIHMSTSFWLAIVLSFPVLTHLVWTFVSPALYPHERRGVGTAFVLGTVLFFAGVAVGYLVVFPVTLRFLADYHVSQWIPNRISLDSYIDTFMLLLLVLGIVFEMPLVAWLLGRLGILRRAFFGRYRRHAVVALLLLSAIITPTGDPFTLTLVFLPIYLLFEASAMFVPRESSAET